jgi:hypothetical protein
MKQFFEAQKKKLDVFLKEYYSITVVTFLVVGFIIHTITFDRVDRVFEHVVLGTHFFIVAITTALLFARGGQLDRRWKITERESILTAIMVFSFGSLFSGFLIFYAKSGSLISSWPFVLVMFVLMIAPEFGKNYFKKMLLQISIFYVAIFSYLIFLVPVIVRKIGPEMYLISGGLSLLVIAIYLRILRRINRKNFIENRNKIIFRIISIFAVFNLLYFTNIIPPIPLSLKASGVYHNFSKTSEYGYRGFYEPASELAFWKTESVTFHRVGSEPVYVFSAIYAPINLNTDIYHRWEYFDPEKTRWVEETNIKIPITGGRIEGYRGFSEKTNLKVGSWRVRITTERNQTIGQILFKIKESSKTPRVIEEDFN